MLEFYKRISGNKQNTYYKNIRDKNDLTLCLCCVSAFSKPFWRVLKILRCSYNVKIQV